MQPWQLVWRFGFLPQFTVAALDALKAGLVADDPALVQGSTTVPPPLLCVADWPVEAADAIGFADRCLEADQLMGEPAACRCFLRAWDETERAEMFSALLAEVDRALAERAAGSVR